jgi:hypothetical protein
VSSTQCGDGHTISLRTVTSDDMIGGHEQVFTAVDESKAGTIDGHMPNMGLDGYGRAVVVILPVALDSSSTVSRGGFGFIRPHNVTSDCNPWHDGGGLLFRRSWSVS